MENDILRRAAAYFARENVERNVERCRFQVRAVAPSHASVTTAAVCLEVSWPSSAQNRRIVWP
jgi:hypothetical protein